MKSLSIRHSGKSREWSHEHGCLSLPRSYASRGCDRSCENAVCGDAMGSYPCSPSL